MKYKIILPLGILLSLLIQSAWSITLQIPSLPSQFPLVIDPYQKSGCVAVWGDNTYGQTNVPMDLTNIVQIAAGGNFCLALRNNGRIVAWGDNTYGQTSIPYRLTNVVQIAAAGLSALALRSDGTVVGWGYNKNGEMNIPSDVTEVVDIAAGGDNSMAIKSNGSIRIWGDNSHGQTNISSSLSDIVQLATSGNFILALKNNGSLSSWGYEPFTAAYAGTNTPPGINNAVQISAGYYSSVALLNDSTVQAWGWSAGGATMVPAGLTNIIQISSGPYFTMALRSNGTVAAWGSLSNSFEGSASSRIPSDLTNVTQVAAGGRFCMALITPKDQDIKGWDVILDKSYSMPFAISPPISDSGLPVSVYVQSGLATIHDNTVFPNGTGIVTLAAYQPGNLYWNPSPKVFVSFVVKPASQTISSFSPILSQVLGAPSFSIGSPTASSGLPVTLSIKSGPATISGNTITLTGTGTVTVAANQPGDENWNAAPEVTTSFVVKSYGQTIGAFSAISDKFYGASPFLITLPIANSKLPVAVTVKSGPARISNNKVTITGAGTVVLAAIQAGNASFAPAAEVTTSFTVYRANQTIRIPQKLKPPVQAGVYPLPSFNSTAGLPVSFSVMSGPAYIDGNNYVVTGPGRVWVAVDQAGNSNYNAAREVSFYFDVGKSTQRISTFGISIPSIPGTYALPSIYSSAGLPVDVILVSGPVRDAGYPYYTIIGPGVVTVRLKQAGNDYYKPAADLVVPFRVKLYDQAIYPFRSIQDQTYGTAPFVVPAPLASSGLPVTVSVKSGPARIRNGLLTITGRGVVTLSANQAGNVNYNAATPTTTSFSVN
jgi:alpha-tubulin suppressor-like RCC1 family protein